MIIVVVVVAAAVVAAAVVAATTAAAAAKATMPFRNISKPGKKLTPPAGSPNVSPHILVL